MITFTQYLSEVFDQTYPYKKVKNSSFLIAYEFKTKNEKNGKVIIYEEDNNNWYIEFTIDESLYITKEGDAFAIFGTVIKIINEFLEERKPKSLNFTAAKSGVEGNNTSRIDLYRRMLKTLTNKAGYEFVEFSGSDETTFTIKKKT